MTEFHYELEHHYDSPPENVFDAFGEGESLGQWWCPPGFESVLVEIDFVVGGRYRIGMRPPGSSDTLFVSGEYVEIDRPSRLVFTHGFEQTPAAELMRAAGLWGVHTRVSISFVAQGGGTRLHLVHELLPSQVAADRIKGGFGGVIKNLGEYLSRRKETP